MNKVITIHLNGNAYQLEEAGYEALRAYLDQSASQLSGNPDKDEILADIEQAFADKCRALLSGYRTVILTREIEQIIGEMGPVDTGGEAADADTPAATDRAADGTRTAPTPPPADGSAGPVRRLYRIYEGAMISGVCNGIAVYLGVDPAIVRLIFVVLAFITFGGMALAYGVLVILLPTARTAAEKAAAQGAPSTAQDFVRRAREGYYDAARAFGDRDAHREWKRRFKHEMHAWRRNFHREWHARAPHWQAQWQGAWMQHPGAWRGLWFTLSLFSLLTGAITVVWICALVSLAMTGAVFGIAMPATMPLWVGILLVCVIFQAVLWPLRAAKHALRHHGWGVNPAGPEPVWFGLWDALVSLAVVGLMIWLADRYVPHFHEALRNLPHWIQEFATSVRDWWQEHRK